jgi:hypothetical protein
MVVKALCRGRSCLARTLASRARGRESATNGTPRSHAGQLTIRRSIQAGKNPSFFRRRIISVQGRIQRPDHRLPTSWYDNRS